MSPAGSTRGPLIALVVAIVLGGPTTSASAQERTFSVIAATSAYTVDAQQGCVSGHRQFNASLIGSVPDDPQNSYTPGPGGFGSITTRSSTTDTSPTAGGFSNDYIANPCAEPPCYYDYGTNPITGGGPSIALYIEDVGDPENVKISTSFLPPGVGDVTNGICGGPIDVDFPFGEPSTMFSLDELLSGKPVTVSIAGTKTFTEDNLGDPASVTVTYDVSMTVQASGGSLQADPGGPYSVKRAGKVKLDGSGSTPKRKIERYRWKFKPAGADCAGVSGKPSRKEGRKTKIVPLCGVEATLTVIAKNGDRDTESTQVNVVPRGPKGWRTPFEHREKTGDPRTPREAPSATSAGGGNYAFSVFGGLNVSDCGRNSDSSEILCPFADNGSWLGSGYELDTVNDPDGPFDGYSYVKSSELKVKRAALINKAILPGSPFYDHNLAAGRDIAGFVNAVRQHEGLGNGSARSGHSLIMKTILESPEGDARRVAEALFAPTRDAARKRVDKALRAIDKRLDTESEDPLVDIWTGDIDFFDSYQQLWITGSGFTIPAG
jgi:hypothetical protein